MYRHGTKIICNVCQGELQIDPSDFCLKTDSSICEQHGWIGIRNRDGINHICLGCIRTVGYAHAFGLAEAALKQFDPQTYGNAELVWRVGDERLPYAELVDLTHPLTYPKEDK